MGIRTAVVVVACCAAAPALPCTFVVPRPDQFIVAEDRAQAAPTNLVLAVLPVDVGPWSAVVHREGADEERIDFEGSVGVDGALDLLADTSYDVEIVVGDVAMRSVSFRTGGGPDDVAPGAPDVTVDRTDVGAHLTFPNSCRDNVGFDGGSTFNELHLTGSDDDLVGFHVVATAPDGAEQERFVDGRGELSLNEGNGGVWSVAVSAIDVAGNEGDASVVDVDFGGCGGCSSASFSSTALALIALGGIRRRRGR